MIQRFITGDWRIGQLLHLVCPVIVGIQTIEFSGSIDALNDSTGIRIPSNEAVQLRLRSANHCRLLTHAALRLRDAAPQSRQSPDGSFLKYKK